VYETRLGTAIKDYQRKNRLRVKAEKIEGKDENDGKDK